MATLSHSQSSQIEKIIIYVPAQLYVAPEATKSKPDYRHQDNVQKQNIYSSTELKQDDHKKKMPQEESKDNSSRDNSSLHDEEMPNREDAATPPQGMPSLPFSFDPKDQSQYLGLLQVLQKELATYRKPSNQQRSSTSLNSMPMLDLQESPTSVQKYQWHKGSNHNLESQQ